MLNNQGGQSTKKLLKADSGKHLQGSLKHAEAVIEKNKTKHNIK